MVSNLDNEAEVKAKLYYTSCMDPNKTIEDLGAQPLLDLIHEFGGWNLITSGSKMRWDPKTWNFQESLEQGHALTLSTFFNMWVGEDEKTLNKTNILQVGLMEWLGLQVPGEVNSVTLWGGKTCNYTPQRHIIIRLAPDQSGGFLSNDWS